MIYNLRGKFILITATSVSIVFALIFAAIFFMKDAPIRRLIGNGKTTWRADAVREKAASACAPQ